MGVISKVVDKAVFLDRDGVINKPVIINGKPFPPSDIASLEIIEGVEEGLIALRKAGFKLFIVTNQPDVARGKTSKESVDIIHDFLLEKLVIDEIDCCFHDGSDNCECRKPKPGMILRLASKWNIDIASSFLIGDRWRDIKAAKNAGMRSILIDYKYDEDYESPDFSCSQFSNAVNYILNHNNFYNEKSK